MPLYEFEYYDDKGERQTFCEFYPISTDFSTIKSPCGNYEAKKLMATFAIHEGMTRAEKNAGTTKKRVEFAKYAKEQRDVRKKEAEPGTRAHDSNEIWVGNEKLDGVINPKSYIKKLPTTETTVLPDYAKIDRPAATPEIVPI